MASVPGFTVAGKTGTAQKVVNGRYSRSEYNASFVGFAPSREPQFAIVVVIDSPHGKNSYFGGPVAAPDLPTYRHAPHCVTVESRHRSTRCLRCWLSAATDPSDRRR